MRWTDAALDEVAAHIQRPLTSLEPKDRRRVFRWIDSAGDKDWADLERRIRRLLEGGRLPA